MLLSIHACARHIIRTEICKYSNNVSIPQLYPATVSRCYALLTQRIFTMCLYSHLPESQCLCTLFIQLPHTLLMAYFPYGTYS